MNSKIFLLGIGTAVLLFAGGVVFLVTQGPNGAGVSASPEKIFDLSFKDYEGNDVSFSDFAGKALVVNSWATWCPFCRNELPDLAQIQEEFAGQVVVVAVDRAESLSRVKEHSDALGVTGRIMLFLDPSDSFYKTIGGFSMPETLFVDKEGVIQDHVRGLMNLKEMREHTQKIVR
jgi:thiol-disulfide isomerase/thioredoxin